VLQYVCAFMDHEFNVFMENVIDVWNDLKERLSQGDLVRASELQEEIYALEQEH
jgi:hypothetical protein